MTLYIPEYFVLQEWLPKDFYDQNKGFGDKLWLMFDYRILWTYDKLRKRYGRVTMNNWLWGGHNQYRGWRPFDCPVGAKLSQHKFGRAGDGVFTMPAEEIRQDIIKHQNDYDFKYISVIEDNVSWLHCDCRNIIPGKGILLI